MRLYAKLSSDKGRRTIGKGAKNSVTLSIYDGNSHILNIEYRREEHELNIYDDTENLIVTIDR